MLASTISKSTALMKLLDPETQNAINFTWHKYHQMSIIGHGFSTLFPKPMETNTETILASSIHSQRFAL